jgi:hypothetical protein
LLYLKAEVIFLKEQAGGVFEASALKKSTI